MQFDLNLSNLLFDMANLTSIYAFQNDVTNANEHKRQLHNSGAIIFSRL